VVVAAAAAFLLLLESSSSSTALCSKSSSSSTSIGVVSVSDHVSKRNEIPLQVYDDCDCDYSILIPAHGITAVTEQKQQQQQKRVELKSLASNIT
jgi:hypothetical protein